MPFLFVLFIYLNRLLIDKSILPSMKYKQDFADSSFAALPSFYALPRILFL